MARRARWRLLAAFATVPMALQIAASADAAGGGGTTLTAVGGVTEESTYTAAKSATGKLAESDQALLARTDDQVVSVAVKLDYDAAASYAGGVAGVPATSPKVTGRKLTGSSDAERKLDAYAGKLEKDFTDQLTAKVGSASVTRSLRTVYGGVVVTLPARDARKLLALPNVAAVQSDSLQQPLTDASNQFIGSPTLWAQEGGKALAGKGVIFADLDSGIWPEHPSLADTGVLGAPPAAPSGLARPCVFGDNPLTATVDVFACNNKVIGGKPFLATYGAAVGFADEPFPTSARDSDGHGTHTTTTAAGIPVANAPVFGVDRGPVAGVAPGAWVLEYKVCGKQGCFQSDSAAAVQQAILDGADVINFSISGGSNPYNDLVELAFLSAYDAGVFVAASAGNSGPGAGSTDHRGPWVTTVAASTQTRAFQSTLTVSDAGTTATFVGSSITKGIATPTAVVLAKNVAGVGALCDFDPKTLADAAKAAVAGRIVACQRGGIGRVQKGANLAGAGAAGMILYNQPLQDTETDNHFLPAVHLADGTAFLAFMAAHPNATATFTDAVKGTDKGDVMAAFSSRGPGGQFLKPDITAPGVQILAGNTPVPDSVPGGPAGQYYQAIAGTSMSAPHVAGSAILLKGLHPDWTPGAIKSALVTTARTGVVKEDLTTKADPFDMGGGRVDLTVAGATTLVFDESAADFKNLGRNPLTAAQVNLPSINAPTMPGVVTVKRTATNVTGRDVEFRASATAPAGARITISPSEGTVRRGRSIDFTIRISSSAPKGQYFGQVNITPKQGPALHLPVAFFNQQGDVALTSDCAPASIVEKASTTCTVTATNNSPSDAAVQLSSNVSENLRFASATGATVRGRTATGAAATLPGAKEGDVSIRQIAAGETPAGGYLPLSLFSDSVVVAAGDETITNFTVPAFTFAGRQYTRIGIVSDGYLVVGGGDNGDVNFVNQRLPNPARPNGVLAPFWTDLNPAFGGAIRINVLTDGVTSWLVVDYAGVVTYSEQKPVDAEVWITLGTATQDITYAYGRTNSGEAGALTVGAENVAGTSGQDLGEGVVPATGGLRVDGTAAVPGGTTSYKLTLIGNDPGTGTLSSSMSADIVPGITVVNTNVKVTKRP